MTTALEFAEKVAAEYGGTPRRYGRELRVRCPCHETGDGHTPSLAVWTRANGTIGWNCMSGCRWRDVTAILSAKGLAPRYQHFNQGDWRRAQELEEKRQLESQAEAAAIFHRMRPLMPGDAPSRYLEDRGLHLNAAERLCIGTVDDAEHSGCEMLCALIVDPASLGTDNVRVVGTQTLAFDRDGNARKIRGKKFRETKGILRGCAVPLGSPHSTAVLAEGVETTLSAMRLLGLPFGLAALSGANIPNIALPSMVKRVIVAADHDRAGALAAHRAYEAFVPLGIDVAVRLWGVKDSGHDANDEWQKRLREPAA